MAPAELLRSDHPQFVSVTAGSLLGPYEIQSRLGQGGMGEVYRARDTRLDRTVAIKMLHVGPAADPERRARFEREAKTLAGLNHPNICTVHDVGEHDGAMFLVMEHLDGQTLAERLAQGPLPLDQALKIAAEVAEALAAAHRQGIIHRDLKPGNVMLTRSGAKLLDFGVAKLTGYGERPAPTASSSALSTQAAPLTGPTIVVGTLQYMAPEQVEARPVDARTDLFAFGVTLYEMISGRRAFEGATPAGVISAILSSEPAPLSSPSAVLPSALDRLVKRCLAKDPANRWDSAHDVADELRWIAEGQADTPRPARPAARRSKTRLLLVAASATIAIGVLIGALMRMRTDGASPLPIRVVLTEQRPASTLTKWPADPQRSLAISRDGRKVVYVAETDGARHLHLRRMESLEPAIVPGTAGAMSPFFSPAGDRIGFFAEGQLKTIPVGGGTSETLAHVGDNPRGGTWTRDDVIIYAPETDAGLWQIPAAGGRPPAIIVQPDVDKHERSYRWPEILPDDDTILFTLAMSDILSFDAARVMARSRRTGEQVEVLRGGSFPSYAETGHLLYARGGELIAVPFDAARKAITGRPEPIMTGIVTYPTNGSAQYAVSGTGTLVFVPGGPIVRAAALTSVDRSGKAQTVGTPAAYQRVRISADGRSAAVDIDSASSNVWILDLVRSTMTRLTAEWNNAGAAWTLDGSRVVFTSARAGKRQLFWQALDSRTAEPLTPAGSAPPSDFTRSSWSPDGRLLAYDRLDPQTGWDIWTLEMNGRRDVRPFLVSSFNERCPTFSPDGRSIAYESDETGRPEIYVQPFPGPAGRTRISTDGGINPVWSRDGRELFYWGPDNASMMAARIAGSPAVAPQRPRLLFRQQSSYPFDVDPNGRFLIIQDEPERPLPSIVAVLNWFEDLRARVPAR